MRLKSLLLAYAFSASASATPYMRSKDFHIDVDPDSGAVLSIVHPNDNASMSWISGPENTPWQPLGSRWGLGYVDLGPLHRAFWNKPRLSVQNNTMKAKYTLDGLDVEVTRTMNDRSHSLDECYSFVNTGNEDLVLGESGAASFALYAPFNDHYTSTEDVLEHRAHAHIWANGGASSWVKLTRMGLRGPHLGLVLTEGELGGYSVESRSTVTSSNTRGFFLLHPRIPMLKRGQSSRVCWSLFWHRDWEDFFEKGKQLSGQFVKVEASSWTAVKGESVDLTLVGREGVRISSESLELVQEEDGYSAVFEASKVGEQEITFTVGEGGSQTNSTVTLNVIPDIDTLIANRIKFIVANQQLGTDFPDQTKAGAYAVYDNQMKDIVTFDTASDRNTGRERVGMGVLIARWLQENPDPDIEKSLRIYYDYVINKLQDATGVVHSWPLGSRTSSPRLYNWPWVMDLHLQMAKLGNKPVTSHNNYTATPTERLVRLVNLFYKQDHAIDYYPINVPIHEALTYFASTNDTTTLRTLLTHWTTHGARIAQVGPNYPSSEVNYEQSIIAPAAIILLELHRFTHEPQWLTAAKSHLARLEAFGGKQPDYHLHDIAIRHWDGYWFGKERMWGDTFPHYWSSLSGIAMHHYAVTTGDEEYGRRAEGVLRGNLMLFREGGEGSCAFVYPVSVDGRKGYALDPYANDQDWALAHYLRVRRDN